MFAGRPLKRRSPKTARHVASSPGFADPRTCRRSPPTGRTATGRCRGRRPRRSRADRSTRGSAIGDVALAAAFQVASRQGGGGDVIRGDGSGDDLMHEEGRDAVRGSAGGEVLRRESRDAGVGLRAGRSTRPGPRDGPTTWRRTPRAASLSLHGRKGATRRRRLGRREGGADRRPSGAGGEGGRHRDQRIGAAQRCGSRPDRRLRPEQGERPTHAGPWVDAATGPRPSAATVPVPPERRQGHRGLEPSLVEAMEGGVAARRADRPAGVPPRRAVGVVTGPGLGPRSRSGPRALPAGGRAP